MKIVIDVKSGYTDEETLYVLRKIGSEGSFSHPAYAELQGREHRLVVEVVGVAREVNAANPGKRYRIDPLEA